MLYEFANEEKEHAGEFLRLLRELGLEEEEFYQEGYGVVEEIIAKLKTKLMKWLQSWCQWSLLFMIKY